MEASAKFSELLKFPCHQNMRIIIDSGEDNKLALIQAINEILGSKLSLADIKESRPSKNGKYISHKIKIQFQSADEMDRLYKELGNRPFVQHIL